MTGAVECLLAVPTRIRCTVTLAWAMYGRLLNCSVFTSRAYCFRCTVVGSYLMEDQFLEKEGIFLLLDLLEVSTLLNDKFTAIKIFFRWKTFWYIDSDETDQYDSHDTPWLKFCCHPSSIAVTSGKNAAKLCLCSRSKSHCITVEQGSA